MDPVASELTNLEDMQVRLRKPSISTARLDAS